jgi:antitoxin MazE
MAQIVQAKIQRWGNGLGLRVAGLMRDIPHFTPDSAVEVEVFEDGFTVRKARQNHRQLPFSETELLAGLTSDTAQAELLAPATAVELDN